MNKINEIYNGFYNEVSTFFDDTYKVSSYAYNELTYENLATTASIIKVVVKETLSQSIFGLPYLAASLTGLAGITTAANAMCGGISIGKGIYSLQSLRQTPATSKNITSKLFNLINGTHALGIGCLLVARELNSNPLLDAALGIYCCTLGLKEFMQSAKKTEKEKRPEKIAKLYVRTLFGGMKVLSAFHLYMIKQGFIKFEFRNYTFERNHAWDSRGQNIEKSEFVFNILQRKAPKEMIYFEKNTLSPFDQAGTCSAMALDFIAQYNTKCAEIKNIPMRLSCIKEIGKYHIGSTEAFNSIQAAFNTINLNQNISFFSGPIDNNLNKIQSIANYHKLTLLSMSEGLITKDTETVLSTIEALPKGSYVVRMLSPTSNHKGESYGHTMSFVKDGELSLYYDNTRGANIFTEIVSNRISEHIRNWLYIPEFRIYKADCPSEGCKNLANDVVVFSSK